MKKPYNKNKKITVSLYCKIYTDTFSEDMQNRTATGEEIFNFLIEDSGHAFTSAGVKISGDCNLWYLGCNEKFGCIEYEDNIIEWGFGESSFDNIEIFVKYLYDEGMLTDERFKILSDKIEEGRKIDNMYDISEYLLCKQCGKEWVKTKESETFRDDFKNMLENVKESFEKKLDIK